MDKSLVTALLAKMGVMHAGKLSIERAQKKLRKRLERHGVPKDLSDAEKELITGLGYDLATMPVNDGKPIDDEAGDDNVQQAPKAEPTPAAPKVDKVAAKPVGKTKVDKVAAAPKVDKVAAAPKVDKVAAAPKVDKVAAAAEPKAKSDKAKPKAKKSGTNAVEAFKSLMTKKPQSKADLIKRLINETGCSEASATAYVCWAKRPVKGKQMNIFGFQIVESKAKDGTKMVARI